jgi:hypothetical protein
LGYLGLPWATLGYLGLPWATLGYLGLPWATLGYLGLPWATLGQSVIQSWATLGYLGLASQAGQVYVLAVKTTALEFLNHDLYSTEKTFLWLQVLMPSC